jgi:hypothetical protein
MKEKIGAINALYPTPTTLVGAMVSGKPNFITIAHPPFLSLCLKSGFELHYMV